MAHYAKNSLPLDRSALPEPIFDEHPGYIDLYWRAWELAWDHVVEKPGASASPYMDEAFDPDTIWIWDTCFMVHFCKFAPHLFPGIQSFDNFYRPLHDGVRSTLQIQHPDNPPLFAWIEHEYLRFTGDLARVERVLVRDQSLQKHYAFIESAQAGQTVPGCVCPLAAQRTPYGYHWNGISSGMDNTPRGRQAYGEILWFDLLAQQALAAQRIAALAARIGRDDLAAPFLTRHENLRALAQRYYWNDEDGTFYDIRHDDPTVQVKVKTPAAYWGLLAGFCDKQQAARLAALADDADGGFGGPVPWPSVTRDDPDFHADGFYWQGGIWLPMAYMATCALRQSGHAEIADRLAERLLAHMFTTWQQAEPSTIWEAYSPTRPEPATDKAEFAGQKVRPDFCGWSALGPISLFIESVIGIHRADALDRTVQWRIHRTTRHGVKRFRFGEIVCDLVYDRGACTVRSSAAFTLVINGQSFPVRPGEQRFAV